MPSEEELDRIVVRLIGDSSSYNKMWKDMKGVATDATNYMSSKVKEFETTLKNVGGSIESFGNKIVGFGTKWSAAITAPITALAGLAINESTQFESALSRMDGLVGLSKEEIAGFSVEIKKLAGITGKGPLELASAMENITSSGIKGKDALETLNVTARAAAGGLGEVRSVSDTVTSAMNAYGVANLSATQATDILVAAVREGKAEADSFAPVLGNVLPIANEMGISFDEAAGSIAYLTLATGSASTAATQYQNILAQVIKLNEKHDSGKVLKEAGIDIKKFQKDVGDKGLFDSLMKLKEALAPKGLTLKDAFPDVQAMTAALQLTGANAEKAKEVIDNVGKAGGSVDKAFGAASQTKAHKFNQQVAEMKVILIELGDMFSEFTGQLMDYTSSGIETWKKLSSESKKFIVSLALGAAALGPILVVGGLIIATVGSMIAGVGTLVGVLGTLTSVLLSPIGIVTALGVAFVTTTKVGRDAFGDLISVIKTEFMAGFETVKENALIAFGGIKDAISGGDIKLALEISLNALELTWVQFTDYLRNVFFYAMKDIKAGWTSGLEYMSNWIADDPIIQKLLGIKKKDIQEFKNQLGILQKNERAAQDTETFKPSNRIAQLDEERKALLEEAKFLARFNELYGGDSIESEFGGVATEPGTKTDIKATTPEGVSELLNPGDVTKKVHVHVDYKTVGAGSGEHADLLASYLSGRSVLDEDHINVNIAKKKKYASPKEKKAAIAEAKSKDDANRIAKNNGDGVVAKESDKVPTKESVNEGVTKEPNKVPTKEAVESKSGNPVSKAQQARIDAQKFDREADETSRKADLLWQDQLDQRREEEARRRIKSDDGKSSEEATQYRVKEDAGIAYKLDQRQAARAKQKVDKAVKEDEVVRQKQAEEKHQQELARAQEIVDRFDQRIKPPEPWQPHHEGYTEAELNNKHETKPWEPTHGTEFTAQDMLRRRPNDNLESSKKPNENLEVNKIPNENLEANRQSPPTSEKTFDEMRGGILRLVELATEEAKKKQSELSLTSAGLDS